LGVTPLSGRQLFSRSQQPSGTPSGERRYGQTEAPRPAQRQQQSI